VNKGGDANLEKLIQNMQSEFEAEVHLILIDKDKSLYQFGTQKKMVKDLHGKLMVHVGGGYMEYPEFYKKYAPMEKRKMERDHAREGSKNRNGSIDSRKGSGKNTPKGESPRTSLGANFKKASEGGLRRPSGFKPKTSSGNLSASGS
jgi:hypothetical protein